MARSWKRAVAFAGPIVLLVGVVMSTGLGAATAAGSSPSGVAPHAVSMMDCNGHSTVYKDVKQDLGGLCTDPVGYWDGQAWRFSDNGSYVGHDEPSVKFISNAPGSGNDMTYVMRMSTDPSAAPTLPNGTSGRNVTDYGELSPAPWFGLPICDPDSYPQNPCRPDSDSNSGEINNPNDAGSAFMELQFYPPGYQPFIDAPSCSATHWCAALTIDSLESKYNFVDLNTACEEPVNFAYLQRNGVPAGPPSPQLSDVSTFTPNSHTLMINPGDTVATTIRDTHHGLLAEVSDLTTHQHGYMVASAANGFMNTNYQTCDGTPFDFHPEYNTARQQNQVPWAALEGGVLMEQEIGHFEACAEITNNLPYTASYANGQSFVDPSTGQTCVGGSEGAGQTGEGPCDPSTGVCQNADTQGGAACPSDNASSGALCEFSDYVCAPQGVRTIQVNGVDETVSWPIAGCQDNYFQNGDLDFNGTSYIPDWPDGTRSHPTSFEYIGPFTHGHTYPNVQFETDVAGSELLCNTATGAGCTAPPTGAPFYPFWTLGSGNQRDHHSQDHGHQQPVACLWNFGNVIAGQTTRSFGGDAEYGTPDTSRYGGTIISSVLANPQTTGACASRGHGH